MARRQVQFKVSQAIAAGCTLMTYKTKLREEGGRQLVSVGPYRTAVPRKGKRYALITKQDQREYGSAVGAAQAFIEFVGRDHAWEALRKKKCLRR